MIFWSSLFLTFLPQHNNIFLLIFLVLLILLKPLVMQRHLHCI